MSDELKFDAELAWDISEWPGAEEDGLSRAEQKSLAAYLTQKGYHKGPRGLTASLEYIESVGATLAEEFIPLYDAMTKRKYGNK